MKTVNNLCIGQVLRNTENQLGRVFGLTAANELQFKVLMYDGSVKFADNANAHLREIDDMAVLTFA